ncbi:MAG: hypothetical protein WA919_19035 [Coleofasciculaceae cyanobacterium]
MNAIDPSRPTSRQSAEPRRIVNRTPRHQRRHHSYGAVASETMIKLIVNVLVSTAAISGLTQLLPYHLSQQAKLREIKQEVKRTEIRVNKLSKDLANNFDPAQTEKNMQRNSFMVDPDQRQVVLQDGESTIDD